MTKPELKLKLQPELEPKLEPTLKLKSEFEPKLELELESKHRTSTWMIFHLNMPKFNYR